MPVKGNYEVLIYGTVIRSTVYFLFITQMNLLTKESSTRGWRWLGSGDGSVLGSKVVGHSFLIRANSVFISPGFIAALSWMGISIGQHNQQGKSNRDVESSSIVFLSSSGHQMRGSSSLAYGVLSSSVWACLSSLIPCPKSYVYWMCIHGWLLKSCFLFLF